MHRSQRWPSNLGIVALNTVLLRLVFPISAVSLAMVVEAQGAGLLHALAVAAIGAPVLAVLAFEVVLNAAAMFNHGDVALPSRLDQVLRWCIVTPDMHRVHHSSVRAETHSNFGFNLPWWDRWFGTHVAQPRDGHVGMQLGLMMFREPIWLRLDRLLIQPWIGPVGPLRGSSRATLHPAPLDEATAIGQPSCLGHDATTSVDPQVVEGRRRAQGTQDG